MRHLTRLAGIFGDPVAHSWSPALHRAAFAALGLDYCYLPFAITRAALPRAVEAIRALGLVGVNVTVPHKERIIDYLDSLTPEARLIGAVNTVVNRGGRLIGDNTDARGFTAALRAKLGMTPRGKAICLLGAGGAARAVAVALAHGGVKQIVIANRSTQRAVALQRHLAAKLGSRAPRIDAVHLAPAALRHAASSCDGLINATSVGLSARDPRLVPRRLLEEFSFVCDLIYNPVATRLLKDARAAGCRTMNGLAMLVHQGALAFELWTHHRAPVRVMERAAAALGRAPQKAR